MITLASIFSLSSRKIPKPKVWFSLPSQYYSSHRPPPPPPPPPSDYDVPEDNGALLFEQELKKLHAENAKLCKFLEGREVVVEACPDVPRNHTKVYLQLSDFQILLQQDINSITSSSLYKTLSTDRIMDNLTQVIVIASGTELAIKLVGTVNDLRCGKGLKESFKNIFNKYPWDDRVQLTNFEDLAKKMILVNSNIEAVETNLGIQRETEKKAKGGKDKEDNGKSEEKENGGKKDGDSDGAGDEKKENGGKKDGDGDGDCAGAGAGDCAGDGAGDCAGAGDIAVPEPPIYIDFF